MGGRPKGLLQTDEGLTLVERSVGLLRSLDVPVVLVGPVAGYASLHLPVIEDDPKGIGPLGGLLALLRTASDRALALACDMPFVSRALLERLIEEREAPVVAPRHDGLWEPLFAVYRRVGVLGRAEARAVSGAHSLQGLLDEVGAAEFVLSPAEAAELRDWDSPADVQRSSTKP
jgi:molybdopterin-guanine dinucleotide biosynthesis protein A